MTADAVGGVWSYALDLAKGLSGYGVRTTLAVLGPGPGPDQRAAAGRIDECAWIETRLPLDWTAAAPGAVREAGDAVAALACALEVDLVHLNSPSLAAEVRCGVPVVGVCHSCVGTWWDAAGQGEMPPDFRWRTEWIVRGYRRCDALIAPSAAYAAAVQRHYGMMPRVVHNGRRPVAVPEMRKRRRVFTAGRLWDRGKNIATLDAAAARLDAPVLAAGPTVGPDGSRIAPRHARALGYLDETAIARQMRSAAVFASVALYEPFGLAVLEAAQAGCALVLSDIPTFRELWNEAAIFVPPTDEAALACVLRELLADSAHCARLGGRARARAARYTVEAMSAGVADVYRSVMGRPAAEEAAA